MIRRRCNYCGVQYEAQTAKSKFCSPRCRLSNHQKPRPTSEIEPATEVRPDSVLAGGVTTATRAALEAAERLETPLGAAAMVLARRMDRGDSEPGSALAALVREHRAALAEALRGANQAANPLDELKARRDRKRAG